MKKTKMSILVVLSILLIITGCSSKGGSDDSGQVTVTYWQHSSPARDAMIKSIVEDFEKENENIKVELEFIPEADYNQKLITALGSGNAPDVFQIQSGMVPKFVDAESILPLDTNVMSKEMMEKEFIGATTEALQVNGEFYGVPTDTQTIIAFWNKGLYKEAGLDPEKGPETWDELFENAKVLTKFEGDLMVQSGWGGKGYPPEVEAIIEQKGGKFFDKETKQFVFADDEKSVAAIEEYANLYRNDKVYDLEFSKNWAGFRQGIVAQMLGHPAMIGNLKETAPDVDYGVSFIPATGDKRTTIVTSWAYVMSKDASTEAATKLINYMSSEDIQKRWTLETGELPSRGSLLEDQDLLNDPKSAVAIKSLEDATVGNLQTKPTYDIWNTAYEKILLTDQDIKEILKEAQDTLNKEYDKQL